jgi:hypothetical protein
MHDFVFPTSERPPKSCINRELTTPMVIDFHYAVPTSSFMKLRIPLYRAGFVRKMPKSMHAATLIIVKTGAFIIR